jgi:hypothetical protein
MTQIAKRAAAGTSTRQWHAERAGIGAHTPAS